MAEKFGFRVQFIKPDEPDEVGGWWVGLPHQCDSWDVAGTEYNALGMSTAADELQRFIDEATEALQALQQGREFGEPI